LYKVHVPHRENPGVLGRYAKKHLEIGSSHAADTVCFIGTTAPLVSITFTRISTFSVYQWAKYVVDAAVERSTGRSPLVLVNTPNTYPDIATIGCFTVAGAMTGAALTPFVGMLLE
jgi:hypothetical protein